MVFKVEEAGVISDVASKMICQIIAAGLKVRVKFSASKEDLFCEIHAPLERLKQFADLVSHFALITKTTIAFGRH